MKNKFFNTPKLKFLYSLIALQLICYTAFRLFFLAFYHRDLAVGTEGFLAKVFYLGFRFDLRLAATLIVPAFILINLPIKTTLKITLNNVIYTLIFGIITFLYVVDGGYYSYLKSRLNATILQFLKNPKISFEMVRESYPWPLLLILILAFTTLCYWLISRFVTPKLEAWHSGTKKEKVFSHIFFFFFFALSLYGSFRMYPLRWSEAFLSPDPFISNLSLNPILYVADTYDFRNSDFDEEKVHQAYPIVSQFLGIDHDSPDYDEKHLNFVRSFPANPERQKQHPNIVVIIMESMGYYKTGLGGSTVNPTPNVDASSVFAAVTSLPDISKIGSGTRNPFVVNQHTAIGELKDYEKYYFLGGSTNWGNIRGVLSYNIPSLHIYEEGSYKSPRVDVWGISDLNLFKEASEVFNQKPQEGTAAKPFFAILQTSGFHRPYTIPKDSDDFKILTTKDVSEKQIRDYGYESIDEFNAMRLQDHSLGKFFELAKKDKWYENTIFLIFGDHSLPSNGAKNVADWQQGISNGYHVPLIIHSPKYIKAGEDAKVASEMDVMPTVAALTGVPYKTRSLGRDLFNPKFDNYRAAFSYNWYAPFHLSLIDKDFYFEYIPYNDNGRIVHISDLHPPENSKDQFAEKYREMETLSKGLYESAKYLLYHNPHMY